MLTEWLSMIENFFQPGHNCWKTGEATRGAVLIDGVNYFAALAASVKLARERIVIFAWAFDTRLRIWLDENDSASGTTLREIFEAALKANPRLELFVLYWDFPEIYSFDREFIPQVRFDSQVMGRVHLEYDGHHPFGASHHQKLILIDADIAFVGGIDCSFGRWDTRKHFVREPRRLSGWGFQSNPYHDIQVILQGPVVIDFCRLANERWHLATGTELPCLTPDNVTDCWPAWVIPDFSKVTVGISRTQPCFFEQEERHEIRAIVLDVVARARRVIYLENQYFTSECICDALVKRLQEAQGPEILLVLPYRLMSRLERATLSRMQANLIKRLRDADKHGRFRVASPVHRGRPKQSIYVHAKLFIVDDTFLSTGSPNLTARSLGFDTELLATIMAENDGTRNAIRKILGSLLGEHRGTEQLDLDEVFLAGAQSKSLFAVLDALGETHEKTLEPPRLPRVATDRTLRFLMRLVDPAAPLRAERVGYRLMRKKRVRLPFGPLSVALFLCVVQGVFAIALFLVPTPLRQSVLNTLALVAAKAAELMPGPWAIVGVCALMLLCYVPVHLVFILCALVWPWYKAAGVLLGGLALSMSFGHTCGRLVSRAKAKKEAMSELRNETHADESGVVTFFVLHFMPLAPFNSFNYKTGAARLPFWPFLGGSLLAHVPSVSLILVFSEVVKRGFSKPRGDLGIEVAVVFCAVFVALVFAVRYSLRKFH